MSVGNEDVAIGRHLHVAGFVELAGAGTGLTRDAERHQHFAFGTELDYLVAFGAFFVALGVGYPDVAFVIDMDAMGQYEQSGAETGQHFAGKAVDLENRIDEIVVAAAGQGEAAAAVIGPDVAIGADIDARRRAPYTVVGKGYPFLDDDGGGVRQRLVCRVGYVGLAVGCYRYETGRDRQAQGSKRFSHDLLRV